jgi:hypothetical protein
MRGRLRSIKGLIFTRLEAGFLHFGIATLCRCSQHGVIWGRMGSNGVKPGEGWGGRALSAPDRVIAGIAVIARDRKERT